MSDEWTLVHCCATRSHLAKGILYGFPNVSQLLCLLTRMNACLPAPLFWTFMFSMAINKRLSGFANTLNTSTLGENCAHIRLVFLLARHFLQQLKSLTFVKATRTREAALFLYTLSQIKRSTPKQNIDFLKLITFVLHRVLGKKSSVLTVMDLTWLW